MTALEESYRRPTDVDAAMAHDRMAVEETLLHEVLHGDDIDAALAAIEPEDFQKGSHRQIWEHMRQLRADRTPVDLATLTEALESSGRLYDIGGTSALLAIMTGWSFMAPALHLAERLSDTARRSRLAEAGRKVAELAAHGDVDVAEVEAILRPQLSTTDRGIESPWDVIDDIQKRHADPDAQSGIRLGWRNLDALYRVVPGLLTIVTGIPGSGKSSWVDHSMMRLAAMQDWRFAVFSPESAPTSRHVLNLSAIKAGKHWSRLNTAEIHESVDWVAERMTWIKSTDGLTLTEVLRRADVIRRQSGIDGLVVDPWNELDHTRPESVTETQHISASLTNLRRWGRRHSVHVWLVAHPKKLDKRMDGTYAAPRMYDISGSSTWHDKADMGVVVHRNKAKPGPVEVQVVKVRFREHGKLGVARLDFDVPSGRYRDEGTL